MNTTYAYLDNLCTNEKARPSILAQCDGFASLMNPYVFRFVFVLWALLFGITEIAFSTTFVVIQSSSGFFIGSDSLRSDPTTNTSKWDEHICKIRSRGDQVMLTWGHTGLTLLYSNGVVKNDSGAFDPIAKRVFSSNNDIKAKRDLLEKESEVFLKEQIRIASKSTQPLSPKQMDSMNIGGVFVSNAVGDYGVYGFYIYVASVADWKNRQLSHSHWDPGDGNLRLGVPIVFGDDQGWADYQSNHVIAVHNPTQREAVDTIKTILELQAHRTPREVGPPFSIAAFESGGLRWIENGACNPQSAKPSRNTKKK